MNKPEVNKAKINYFVDLGLAVSFIACALTGIIKFPRLFSKLGIGLSGLPMYEISRLHDWSGLVLVILVGVHLILHYNWICCMTKSFFRKDSCEVKDEKNSSIKKK